MYMSAWRGMKKFMVERWDGFGEINMEGERV